jgi:amino acid adenylation domain-containing protein
VPLDQQISRTRPIEKAAARDEFPLSFAQERILFLTELEPDATNYNCPHIVRLKGWLQPAALEASIDQMLRRHEILRTVFKFKNDQPVQNVEPAKPFKLPFIDLAHLPDRIRKKEVLRLAKIEAQRPFALSAGPLVRVTLVRLSDEEHFVLFTLHHIIADDWSMGLFVEGITEYYEAFRKGAPSLSKEPDLHYGDFAVWQRRWLASPSVDQQRGYWKRQLADPPILKLPIDRPRPAIQRHRGSKQFLLIDRELTDALNTLSQQEDATLFITLLAALQLLLHRYSGQRDITVGVPIAGRTRVEFEDLIGFFLNTLVMRIRIKGDVEFRSLLRQVRETALDAYSHQDLPFEKIVEELQPNRDLSHSPFFQVMLVFQQRPPAHLTIPSLTMEPVDIVTDTAKFDLVFMVTENANGLSISIEYDTDLFDAGTIDRLKQHYRILLQSIAAAPESKISALPLLGSDELTRLLEASNETRSDYPTESLYSLFANQALRTPDTIALVCEDQHLSYAELKLRAERLSTRLRDVGVGREDAVGLYLERSPESVESILAILHAGGSYVPLDPSYPAERLRQIATSANLQTVVTHSRLLESLPDCFRSVLCIDERGQVDPHKRGAQPAPTTPADVAYLLHTSGSTGRPKLVAGTHRGIMNRLWWMWQKYPFDGSETHCHRTSLNFVDSINEIFSPLLKGQRLVIVPEHVGRDAELLVDLLCREEVDRLVVVPSLLRVIADIKIAARQSLQGPRLWISSGEALAPEDVIKFHRAWPSATLLNLYGSCEVAADATFAELTRDQPTAFVPIGQPIQNMRVYVVDSYGQSSPFGVTGELLVGGDGLARGYFGAPAATAERFVPDPFGKQPGARLYRTGDLAHFVAQGDLVFVGRVDRQVKLRGYRIEVEEVEAVLSSHPAVSQATVIVEPKVGLVGYYVSHSPNGDDYELRSYIAERLPGYMVPAHFVRLPEMPLTSSGKLNRAALPPYTNNTADDYVAPRNALEMRIASVWRRVLSLPKVGVQSNFFALGGHSLLGTRLVQQLRSALNREVPLRILFEAPTVAGMAASISEGSDTDSIESWLPNIEPDPARRHDPFPTTDMQQAYWVGRTNALHLGDVSIHAYSEIEGKDVDLDRFTHAWRRLIQRHDMLRAVVCDGFTQRILPRVPTFYIPLEDFRGLPAAAAESELQAIRTEMSHQVLALDKWPAFDIRASLLEGDVVRLHISIDTFFIDGWSQKILLDELLELYDNPEAELPPLELSFRDYVLAEQALIKTPQYERVHEQWRRRLEDMASGPNLPLATDPSLLKRARFRKLATVMDPGIGRMLREQCSAFELSVVDTLLAAFARVLARWSTSPRFALSVPTFNRLLMHPEVNQLVGPFSSFMIVDLDTAEAANFAGLARIVHQQLMWGVERPVVSGVRLTRELFQHKGFQLFLPVVFTSLGFGLDEDRRTSTRHPAFTEVFSVGQTPQIWLDNRVRFDSDDLLGIEWDVVEGLFPAGMVDAMFDAYIELLRGLATGPNAWQDFMTAAMPSALQSLIDSVNSTEAVIPNELLHSGFLREVRRDPLHPAIRTAERNLSFGELYQLARNLADELVDAGARPNTLVAIVMKKGWEEVVGALAILLSGAAYLPLDAGLPAERLHLVLAEGDVRVVLTQSAFVESIQWPKGLRLIAVDAPDRQQLKAVSGPSRSDVVSAVHDSTAGNADHLAYVIYTSGSTGRPKGVMITHRAALNTIRDINHRFGVDPNDRLFGISALSFDLSVYDIFGAFDAGATLVLPPDRERLDPAYCCEMIAREGVTLWNSVPALMELLVDYAGAPTRAANGALRTLRLVLLSGDWIPLRLPEKLRAINPECEVISLGGATEAAIWSVIHPIREVKPEWASIPYGRPLLNQQTYILNERYELCPASVPGQLYIAGTGLAVGYWRDPERTRKSFITHPQNKQRLYRTGDVAKYSLNGEIELLGRDDQQVKLNGYRIELGEVEAALLQHPRIQAAAVVAAKRARGQRQLVAYVVVKSDVATATAAPIETAPTAQEARIEALKKLEFRLSQPSIRKLKKDRQTVPLINSNGKDLAAFLSRRSHRRFLAESLSVTQFAGFLSCLKQEKITQLPFPKYQYGSAGNLYPVQTYIYLKEGAVSSTPGGYYYYHPVDHCLIKLSEGPELEAARFGPPNIEIFRSASFAIFLIAQMNAIRPIYREESTRFAAIEAGLITQLLEMTAPASSVGLCQIGGLDFTSLAERFQLDTDHVLLHSIIGGPINPDEDPIAGMKADSGAYSADFVKHRDVAETHVSDATLSEELRTWLKTKLPEYMVPVQFVALDRLPLSATGKIDRRSLSERGASEVVTDSVPPVTVTSSVSGLVAQIWGEVLDVETPRGDADFFKMGGNSLTAIQLATKIQDAFGVRVPLAEFLKYPTLVSLTDLVATLRAQQGSTSSALILPKAEPDPANWYEPFSLTPIQQAYWIGRSSEITLGSVSTHIYVEIEVSFLDLDRLNEALNVLIARHQMMRCIVQPNGRQRILEQVPTYQISLVDLRSSPRQEVDERLMITRERMSHQVFQSDQWPLFEICAHRLDDDRYRLHLSVDLLIADARSFQILHRELLKIYYEGPDVPLTRLDFSFRDYVVAEEAIRSSELFSRARSYWLNCLAELPPPPSLPLVSDPSRLDRPSFARLHRQFDASLWGALKSAAAEQELTPSAVLCAAFSRVLATWSNSSRFTLNLTTFNRLPLHPSVEALVGDFTSTTLLAVKISDDTFAGFARNVQRQMWSDLEHRIFSGVHVLREKSRLDGKIKSAMMPVVFTSTLIHSNEGSSARSGLESEVVYSVSQTPQVLLDHQVSEYDNKLLCNWDYVAEIFPEGLIPAMFDAYCTLLSRLATREEAWTEPV